MASIPTREYAGCGLCRRLYHIIQRVNKISIATAKIAEAIHTAIHVSVKFVTSVLDGNAAREDGVGVIERDGEGVDVIEREGVDVIEREGVDEELVDGDGDGLVEGHHLV